MLIGYQYFIGLWVYGPEISRIFGAVNGLIDPDQ
jgi:hypothetical protein